MKIVGILVAGCALMLGGCSHYSDELSSLDNKMGRGEGFVTASRLSPEEIEPAAGAAMLGSEAGKAAGAQVDEVAFNRALAQEYYNLAKHENDRAYDYKAAKIYTEKAALATNGTMPRPSRVTDYDLQPTEMIQLTAARKKLLTAIKNNMIPQNHVALAKAQASYDCWLEQSEEATSDAHYRICKENFEKAIGSLVNPMVLAASHNATFEFAPNSAVLDTASDAALDRLADYLNSSEGQKYSLVLTGYTEADARLEAGRNLSTDRVRAVHAALVERGVDAERLILQLGRAPENKAVVQQAADMGTRGEGAVNASRLVQGSLVIVQ